MALSAAAGAIAGLVRLVIFIGILWYIGSVLLRIPPIRAFADALRSGDSARVTATAEDIRSWFQSLLSSGQDEAVVSSPDAASEASDVETPPDDGSGRYAYEPGNGVSMPQPTRRVDPAYTTDAMRRKIEGSVLLSCIVRPDFTVSDVVVVRSLDRGLDQEAIKALEQWQFTPGRRNGRYVPVRITVEMTFTLP